MTKTECKHKTVRPNGLCDWCGYNTKGLTSKELKKWVNLYYHKTDGGAEYLMDTFILCDSGHKEGIINDETKYIVRIDGDITKDAELIIK